MKIAFLDKFGKFTVKETTIPIIPRVGDKIGFYNQHPLPTVTDVVLWPDLSRFGISTTHSVQVLVLID